MLLDLLPQHKRNFKFIFIRSQIELAPVCLCHAADTGEADSGSFVFGRVNPAFKDGKFSIPVVFHGDQQVALCNLCVYFYGAELLGQLFRGFEGIFQEIAKQNSEVPGFQL